MPYNSFVVVERTVILEPKLNGITSWALLFQTLYYICKPERKSDLRLLTMKYHSNRLSISGSLHMCMDSTLHGHRKWFDIKNSKEHQIKRKTYARPRFNFT